MRKSISTALLLITVLLAGCGDAPKGPEKGTPAFSWNAAQETFAKADFGKTADHLDALLKTENEYTARAVAWRLVLLWGELKGLTDMADKFEYGARDNKANPTPFRKVVNDTRSMAGQTAGRVAEVWGKYKKPADGVTLELPFPPGTSAQVGGVINASKGIVQAPAEIDSIRKAVVQRGVLLALSGVVGAGEDVAKAREVLKTGSAKIPVETFQMAMAEALFDAASVFGKQKLDRPDSLKLLAGKAAEVLKEVPASKETKALGAKIEESLKKAK